MSVVVRRATTADAARVDRLRSASWRAAYTGIAPEDLLAGFTDTNHTEAIAKSMVEREERGGRMFIAERGGIEEGFLSCGPARDAERAGDGEVYGFYVHPRAWGTGVGKTLIRSALGFLAACGHRLGVLWTFEANERARGFYERGGWRHDGVVRSHDVWIMPEVRYERPLPRVRHAEEADAAAIARVHVGTWQAYRSPIADEVLDSFSV